MNPKQVSRLAILPLITYPRCLLLCRNTYLKVGGKFYCLYVDFQKAFDKVEHKQLFKSH